VTRTFQNVGLGLGTVASALVLASGIIEYPLIELALYGTLGFVFVVVVGIWLGAIWPVRLALAAGNAGVIAGVASIWLVYRGAPMVQIAPILFFGAALLLAFGYPLSAVALARGILAKVARPA